LLQLSPNNCVKPPIEFENYRLRWSRNSPGIPENEISEITRFFRNVVPHLKRMADASRKIEDESEKVVNSDAADLNIHAFCPFVHLSYGVGVTFDVSTTWDGVFFLDRIEEIRLRKGNEPESLTSSFQLKWEIGEIVEKHDGFFSKFDSKHDVPQRPLVNASSSGTLPESMHLVAQDGYVTEFQLVR